MTDDSTMDKKGFCNPPLKSVQETSSRSKQDGNGGNQLSKNFTKSSFKRRESPARANNVPVNRDSRKPTPQKSKAMDKRPRARGNCSGEQVTPSHDAYEPEMGSIQTPGSKKQNLNHLLNFHFAPRPSQSNSPGSWHSYNTHQGGTWRSQKGSGAQSGRPKFNKEQFLQANCQFMVQNIADYTVYKADPDILVNWDDVEQIFIGSTGGTPACPICLAPPVAAKMTRCGHIFCWPCMLHYLALSDKPSRACPICYDSIKRCDLKSVVSRLSFEVEVGSEIEMQLMCCAKNSYDAMPLMCKPGAVFDWEPIYSKLLVVSPDQVKNQVIHREIRELRALYSDDPHCPEVCFIEEALRESEVREKSIGICQFAEESPETSVLDSDLPGEEKNLGAAMNPGSQCDLVDRQKERHESVGSDSSTGDDESWIKEPDRIGYYYYYQASDGQKIFLHPLNMAMLWKAFGDDVNQWPQMVQFKVIEKEYLSMTEGVRKRLKFLRHLPLSSSFVLVEVELKPPVVPRNVYKEFSGQLSSREKRRKEKVTEERKREKKMKEEERKKRNFMPFPKIESRQDFPDCGFGELHGLDEEFPLVAIVEDEPQGDANSSGFDNNQLHKGDPVAAGGTSISFAKIVSAPSKMGMSRSPTYPLTGAWGRGSHVNQSARLSESDQDADEGSTVPLFRNSISDAIAKAFENVNVTADNGITPEESTPSGQKKKKKKGKVLFSTAMGCMQ